MEAKTKVLFLCTANTARSQMAEAFLREHGSERFDSFSAGLEPRAIHRMTRLVMEEKGIDLSEHYAKPLSLYMGKVHFGYLITVCRRAAENCPRTFLGMGQRIHWELDDPAGFEGSELEKLNKFREIRDLIEQKVLDWISEQG